MPYSFCCSSLLFNYSEHTALIPNSFTAILAQFYQLLVLCRRSSSSCNVAHSIVGNLSRPLKLVCLLLGRLYLRLATRSIRTSPIACCGYIARSVLPLPAVCCLSCPLSAPVGLSIAAAGGCLSLRLCAAYRYALIEGLDGLNVHACQRPCAALNLAACVIGYIVRRGLFGGLFGG